MKVRITTRNIYIVEDVDSIEEAMSALDQLIRPDPKSRVRFEHALILSKEEVR